jgi:GNAT superfamily N-acetyltransferase
VANIESEINQSSITTSIASSGTFKIELIKKIGNSDKKDLIEISKSLAAEYGSRSLLTEKTIDIYFNREGTLPLIARSQKNIIGYIIGLPLESLSKEPWARLDENYEKYNTIYTYAFVIKDEYKGNGYAKMLKKVYLNWAKKRDGINFITGHVRLGITSRFKGEIKIINQVENWQGTGKIFEYYRRNLDPEKIHSP